MISILNRELIFTFRQFFLHSIIWDWRISGQLHFDLYYKFLIYCSSSDLYLFSRSSVVCCRKQVHNGNLRYLGCKVKMAGNTWREGIFFIWIEIGASRQPARSCIHACGANHAPAARTRQFFTHIRMRDAFSRWVTVFLDAWHFYSYK